MLSPKQFDGPYSAWDSDHQFANTRRYANALADAPAFPDRQVEGKYTEAKANAIRQEKQEWRDAYGSLVPSGPVHPNAVKRRRSGTQVPYDRDFLASNPRPQVTEVDPRALHGIQPGVHAQGVEHYLGDQYRRTGTTFEQTKGMAATDANRLPTVYQREDGLNVVLAGHHRAAAALAQGRGLLSRVVRGPVPRS